MAIPDEIMTIQEIAALLDEPESKVQLLLKQGWLSSCQRRDVEAFASTLRGVNESINVWAGLLNLVETLLEPLQKMFSTEESMRQAHLWEGVAALLKHPPIGASIIPPTRYMGPFSRWLELPPPQLPPEQSWEHFAEQLRSSHLLGNPGFFLSPSILDSFLDDSGQTRPILEADLSELEAFDDDKPEEEEPPSARPMCSRLPSPQPNEKEEPLVINFPREQSFATQIANRFGISEQLIMRHTDIEDDKETFEEL